MKGIAIEQTEAGNTHITDIILNTSQSYSGDLKHYFRIIFGNAKNTQNPYHNFRHIFHVLWLCHDAIMYYSNQPHGKLSLREARHLLIAAMFHDFDHSGRVGNDDLEIEVARRGLRKHILDEDKPMLEEIENLITHTKFPHEVSSSELTLSGQILRDADISQALSNVWMQQILFGLSVEMNVQPIEMLRIQKSFLRKIRFSTDWAKSRFNPVVIEFNIRQTETLQHILES